MSPIPARLLLTLTLCLGVALPVAWAQEFVPVSDKDLRDPAAEDWVRWRRDHSAGGYSPLKQIDRDNVTRLRLAWTWPMGPGRQQQEPLVHQGRMYLLHADATIQALDARDGNLIWEHRRTLPEQVRSDSTRNLAIYRDKVFTSTQDGYLLALDARDGSPAWEVQTADYRQLINYSTGPIAADGRIFAGHTCSTGTTISCYISAHDADTGKLLWQRESVAGPGDPEAHNATWGGVPYERRLKASFWMAGSYDPELKLLYWTTASAAPYPEIVKGTGKGDLLYTNSILALDAATGAIRWFFQMHPRDNFDMDHQDNPILADVEIDGTMRKVVLVLGKPGILWAFDRETGAHLWNRLLVPYQNLYSHIDPITGRVTPNEKIIPTQLGVEQLVCPGVRGGKLFQTNAYNPVTGAVYSPVNNECTVFQAVSADETASGLRYGQLLHMEGSGEKVGSLTAVSASSGRLMWSYHQRAALGSVLTTAGGLIFFGDLHRYFRALDAQDGKPLWEVPLSAPVMGYPISFAVNGKQHVAVAVGGSSSGQLHLSQLYPELDTPRGDNILMVFALGD